LRKNSRLGCAWFAALFGAPAREFFYGFASGGYSTRLRGRQIRKTFRHHENRRGASTLQTLDNVRYFRGRSLYYDEAFAFQTQCGISVTTVPV